MNRNLRYKAIFIVVVLLVCVYGIIGFPKSRAELVANWKKNIRLGLDLKGGTYLIMQVQLQDVFNGEADDLVDRLKAAMDKRGILGADVKVARRAESFAEAEQVQVSVTGIPGAKVADFRELVAEFRDWDPKPTNTTATDYSLTFFKSAATERKQEAVKRSINVIENRINGLGLTEASVQQRGRTDAEAEILIQMPDVGDVARANAMMKTAAILEIRLVLGGPYASEGQMLAERRGVRPLNTELLPFPREGRAGETPPLYLLSRKAELRGMDIRDARAERGDGFESWQTSFILKPDAGTRFAEFTGSHIEQKLAVVLDRQIASVATIQARIGDSGRITGMPDEDAARDLAIKLRAGALPAGLVELQTTTIGPSLGADSIREGLIAGLVGLVAVVAVMLFYYRRSGVNATLALILNALVLIACLSYFEAVLTLPGIAGVILTIGIAVDSNVLIFERIREELRTGKAVVTAIDTGFSRAFLTIIDTHVTTVVSCAFLFIFGTGPVKGFAVTLVIGLVANVFTAVFVSKTIFDFEMAGKRQVTTLSI